MKELLAKKIGMTQIFNKEGKFIPVTVLLAGPCVIIQQRNERENMRMAQMGFDEMAMKKVTKPLKGHFQKAKVPAFRFIKEFRISKEEKIEVGQTIKADIYKEGDLVDVTGISKGKGFQGVMKRWNFSGGGGSHGSMFHRAPGSIGSSSDPSRVFKGLRMAGHMGNSGSTAQNLEVVKVDNDKNILLVKGAVPGMKNGFLIIRKSGEVRRQVKLVPINAAKQTRETPKKEKK